MPANIPAVGSRLFLVVTSFDEITGETTHGEYTEQQWMQEVYPQMLQDKIAQYGQEWVNQNPAHEICLAEWIEAVQAWQLI